MGRKKDGSTVYIGQIVHEVADSTYISQVKANKVIQEFLDTIQDHVALNDTVTIKNFGTFENLENNYPSNLTNENGDNIKNKKKAKYRRVAFRSARFFKDKINRVARINRF